MKMTKKVIAVLLAVLFVAAAFAGCSSGTDGESAANDASNIKIGVIEVGDDTETYTKVHSDGIKEAAAALGISEDQILWKTKVEETEDCKTAAEALVADGCTVVISNSYGHQDYMVQVAEEFPEVDFVAMTGDFAAISNLDNFYNAFSKVFESRYVSGVVAGMKVAELVENNQLSADNYDADGNVKIGYVGAFNYAEVISGDTAFFLGIKSIYPEVSMEVQYTNSWFDIDAEAEAAKVLMNDGCVIIGQHADSTGAPTAVETAYQNGTLAFSVGYNMSMLDVAPTVSLTSPTTDWAVYYKALFEAEINGTEVPQDFAAGYEVDGVYITELGPNVAEGTAEKVAEVEAALKDGSLKVFDTSTFTVNGETLTTASVDLSYMDYSTMTPIYQGETVECIKTDEATGITYFDESTYRAAPYFSIIIDGITELN